MCSWFVSFPLDVVKANIQGESPGTPIEKRMKFKKVVMSRFYEAGLAGFYWGVAPSLLRAFFVSGSRFSAYEVTLRLLSRLDEHLSQTKLNN